MKEQKKTLNKMMNYNLNSNGIIKLITNTILAKKMTEKMDKVQRNACIQEKRVNENTIYK